MTDLKKGDKYTMAGCGWGSKGQEVMFNYNHKTKRKCKAVKLRTYVVTEVITGSYELPAIAPDLHKEANE